MNQEEKENIVVCAINSDMSLVGIELSIVQYAYLDKEKDQWSINNKLFFKQYEYPQKLRNKIILTIKEYSKKTQEKFDDKLVNDLEKDYGEFINKILDELGEQIKSNSVTLFAFNTLLIQLMEYNTQKPKSAVFLSKFCQEIAKIQQQRVICNFFAYDFYLKGNGGPYQIIGQAKLFAQQNALINLSGIASFTYFKNKDDFETYKGDFICPAMFALNYASNWEKEDLKKGIQSTTIDDEFLQQLGNQFKFNYSVLYFGRLMEFIDQQKSNPIIKVATLKQYISQEIQSYLKDKQQQGKIYVGGNFSEDLFKFLQKEIKDVEIIESQDYQQIDSIITGFLAIRKNKQLLNVFKGATKSSSDHSSGVIYIKTDKPITITKEPEIKKPQEPKQKLENSEDFDIAIQNQDDRQDIKISQTKQIGKK